MHGGGVPFFFTATGLVDHTQPTSSSHIDFSEATYTIWLLRNYRTRCKFDNFRLRDEQSLQLGVYVQPYSTQCLQPM